MEPLRSIAERYWMAYYLVYVAGVGLGFWRYRPLQEQGKDELLVLVAIFALAAGVALLVAIFLEIIGRMVLLIPAAWKQIKEQGRKEGREEGREEERQRILNALAQLRQREDAAVQVPPEVIEILLGESESRF